MDMDMDMDVDPPFKLADLPTKAEMSKLALRLLRERAAHDPKLAAKMRRMGLKVGA